MALGQAFRRTGLAVAFIASAAVPLLATPRVLASVPAPDQVRVPGGAAAVRRLLVLDTRRPADSLFVDVQEALLSDANPHAAWNEAPNVLGWAAFKIADRVRSFHGYGMGSYSFFNQGVDIFAANAFEVPEALPAGSLNDLLTIFLDPSNGKGGILNVVNDTGGSSTIANPDVPVTVVSYP